MTRGVFRKGFWGGVILAGHVLPLLILTFTPFTMLPAVLATYALMRAPLLRRLMLVMLFIGAFAAASAGWSRYWANEAVRADAFVTRAGGKVLAAPHGSHHAFWHAIACGLGDFGGAYGYRWDDRAAFAWATTRSAQNPRPLAHHWSHGYFLDETYDGVHPIAPTDLPEYNALMRKRVLSDIGRDPAWYAGVLGQRVLAVLRDATPAALSIGSRTYAIPGAGWLLLPVLAFTILRRRDYHTRLILYLLPLSAVALVVYSGRGATYYGVAHLIALAVAIDLLLRSRSTEAGRTVDAH